MMAKSDVQKYQETNKRLKMPYQMLAIMKQPCSFHYQILILLN